MKKISFFLTSAIALLFAACAESTFEMHQTYFYPQEPDGKKFYADETYDSTQVFSYDPWTAEIEATDPWFTITPTSGDARPGTSALTRMDIRMPQNTTGKNHRGRIVVKTYDNNQIALPVFQSAWLDIISPRATLKGDTYEEQTATFEVTLLALDKSKDITFHVYQDGATLSSDAEWVTPEKTTFDKGQHTVKLNIVPNESKQERQATITLTSGKISTPIQVKQEGKKDEK